MTPHPSDADKIFRLIEALIKARAAEPPIILPPAKRSMNDPFDREVRLRCLELAVNAPGDPIAMARQFYEFATDQEDARNLRVGVTPRADDVA